MTPRDGLRLGGLEKAFGRRGVRGVDLEVRPAGCARCSDRSGCGKTTALRMIAGLEDPDAGKIVVGDRTVSGQGGSVRSRAGGSGWCSRTTRCFRTWTSRRTSATGSGASRIPSACRRPCGLVGLGDSGRAARPPAVGRQAAAGRLGARARADAVARAARRAVLEPRREPARAAAPGGLRDPAQGGRDRDVRDARPGGGDEHRRAGRGHARRARRAVRDARGGLPAPRDALDGDVPRRHRGAARRGAVKGRARCELGSLPIEAADRGRGRRARATRGARGRRERAGQRGPRRGRVAALLRPRPAARPAVGVRAGRAVAAARLSGVASRRSRAGVDRGARSRFCRARRSAGGRRRVRRSVYRETWPSATITTSPATRGRSSAHVHSSRLGRPIWSPWRIVSDCVSARSRR